ncbi:hypothetical protein D9M69_513270 [compost metagenome]
MHRANRAEHIGRHARGGSCGLNGCGRWRCSDRCSRGGRRGRYRCGNRCRSGHRHRAGHDVREAVVALGHGGAHARTRLVQVLVDGHVRAVRHILALQRLGDTVAAIFTAHTHIAGTQTVLRAQIGQACSAHGGFALATQRAHLGAGLVELGSSRLNGRIALGSGVVADVAILVRHLACVHVKSKEGATQKEQEGLERIPRHVVIQKQSKKRQTDHTHIRVNPRHCAQRSIVARTHGGKPKNRVTK